MVPVSAEVGTEVTIVVSFSMKAELLAPPKYAIAKSGFEILGFLS